MELKPEFVPPLLRFIPQTLGLPDGEAATAQYIFTNLYGMREQSKALSASLALIETSETLPVSDMMNWHNSMWMLWRMIAFRSGAMALSNFYKCLAKARRLVADCPHIAPLVDTEALRDLDKEFRARWPRVEKLRDSAAHPEFYGDPKMDMTGAAGPVGDFQADWNKQRVPGTFHNRRYAATAFRLIVQYELTQETALYVVDCVRRTYAAFSGATPAEVARLLAQD